MNEWPVKLLSFILIIIGLLIFAVKIYDLNLPLTPDKKSEIWTVEAKITVDVDNGPTKIKFYIPKKPYNYQVINEDFVSGEYGQTIEDDGVNRYILWAVRKDSGRDILYYRIQLSSAPGRNARRIKPMISYVPTPKYTDIERTAVNAILSRVRRSSADIVTFSKELIKVVNENSESENIKILMKDVRGDRDLALKIKYILAGAHIPARLIYLLQLKDGARNARFMPFLEVNNGSEWIALNPKTGSSGIPNDTFIWKTESENPVTISGGKIVDLNISIIRAFKEILPIIKENVDVSKSPLIEYSLLSLPVNTQNLYRILLLLPLGALVVVFMRNFIGIETNGTFMPILIALSFRETHLLLGIILFTIIVSVGLFLRFYLEKLKLLMIPRLSAILTIVILLMLVISIISNKLGIPSALSIALFPLVIITMTIERLSIVWEERGRSEALKQGVGSLIVAVIGYFFMQNSILQHLFFLFPELLLVILGIMILMGRYTGYRLLEFYRYRYLLIHKK